MLLAGAMGNLLDCMFYGMIFTQSSPFYTSYLVPFGVLAAAVSGYKNKLEEEEKAIEKAQKAAAAKAKAEAARKEVA